MKLIIHETGDTSVGIQPRYYTIDCPFEREDVGKADLEEFKYDVLKSFKPFAETHMGAAYDFEMEEEARQEDEIDRMVADFQQRLDNEPI